MNQTCSRQVSTVLLFGIFMVLLGAVQSASGRPSNMREVRAIDNPHYLGSRVGSFYAMMSVDEPSVADHLARHVPSLDGYIYDFIAYMRREEEEITADLRRHERLGVCKPNQTVSKLERVFDSTSERRLRAYAKSFAKIKDEFGMQVFEETKAFMDEITENETIYSVDFADVLIDQDLTVDQFVSNYCTQPSE